MNRLEYMTELRKHLVEGGLGNEEINDAMQFYEEIFLDAGVEHEEQTSQTLGAPDKLARQILMDNDIHADGDAEFMMEGAVDSTQQNIPPQPVYQTNNSKAVLIVILVVTAFIWVPVVFGVGCAICGVAVGLIAAVAGIAIAGIGMMAGGVYALFTTPPVGLVLFGIGTFLTGLAVLILVPIIKGLWHLVVRFFNWIVGAIRNILGTGRVKQNG